MAIPDQSHMQGQKLSGFVEEDTKVMNLMVLRLLTIVNPGANGWAIVESSNHQNIWK